MNIAYFGQLPTTIVLRTSDNFDGAAQVADPVITPGLYTFPVQSGGGLYSFHDQQIDVKNVSYAGSGSLSVIKIVGGQNVLLTTLTAAGGEMFENTTLSPGESLKFVSTGTAGNQIVAITSALTSGFWAT